MDEDCDKFTIDFFNNPELQQSRMWTLSEMDCDDFTSTITELITSARRLKIDERLITLFNRRYNKFITEKDEFLRFKMSEKYIHLKLSDIFINDGMQKWFIVMSSKLTENDDLEGFEKMYTDMIKEENISHIDLLKLSNRYNNYIANGHKFDDEL